MGSAVSWVLLAGVALWAGLRGRRMWRDPVLSASDKHRRLAGVIFLVSVVVTAVGRFALGSVAQLYVVLAGLGAAAALEVRGRRMDEQVMRRRRDRAAASGEPVEPLLMAPATAGLLALVGMVSLWQLYSLALGMDGFQKVVRSMGTASPESVAWVGMASLAIAVVLVLLPLPVAWLTFRIQEKRVRHATRDHAAAVARFEERLERERQRAVGDYRSAQMWQRQKGSQQ